MISIKFLLVTVNTLSNRVVMRIVDMITEDESKIIDTLTNSPHYFYLKCEGTTNEN